MKRLDYIIESNIPPLDKNVFWIKEGILRYNYDNEWIPVVNNGYPKIRKVSKFIHKVDFDRLNYKLALNYLEGIDISTHSFGCSAFKKGDFFCRNYDWYYDNSPTFIVTTPAYDDKYATLGVANGVLNQNFNTPISVINRAIELMPFYLLDGINEKGVFCSLNVVPTDKGSMIHTTPLIEERDRICNIILGRYIIDNFATADEAIDYLRKYVTIFPSKSLQSMGYELHYLIGDDTKTYVMEIVNNEIVVKEHNIMTNFHIDGVTFNNDGTVYTALNIPEHYPSEDNGITPFGAGLERYNIIVNNIESVTTKDFARNLLKNIYFTRAYRAESLGINEWYSDFVGTYSDRIITVDSSPEEINPIIAKAKEYYWHRNRNIRNTWQTVHSSIYDISTKSLYITAQEEEVEYRFTLEQTFISGSKGTIPPTDNHILISNLDGEAEDSGVSVDDIKLFEKGVGEHSVQLRGENNHARGEASTAEGINTTADATGAHSEGNQTIATANFSHVEGNKTTAGGQASHAEGNNTTTNNQAEHAEGRYNYSHTGDTEAECTQHSIGIGHATQDMSGRKNAVEVMQNGDMYLLGIGGYNGTNPSSANIKTLKQVVDVIISNLENKQNILISGNNIKTIDNQSILGFGNITTQGSVESLSINNKLIENITYDSDNYSVLGITQEEYQHILQCSYDYIDYTYDNFFGNIKPRLHKMQNSGSSTGGYISIIPNNNGKVTVFKIELNYSTRQSSIVSFTYKNWTVDIGELSNLTTTVKTSLVAAINELVSTKQHTLTPGSGISILNNIISATGSTGTSDYNDLSNKPSINNIELEGNLSLQDLGIQSVISDLQTIISGAAAGATAYQKPQNGIPATDLESSIQTKLNNIVPSKEIIYNDTDSIITLPSLNSSKVYKYMVSTGVTNLSFNSTVFESIDPEKDDEYKFKFISGATATVVIWPNTFKFQGGITPVIEANCIYEVSIDSDQCVLIKAFK